MKDKWYTKEYITQMELKANKALGIVGDALVGYTKAITTVGTPESTGIKGYRGGTLRGSITTEKGHLKVGVGTNVEYAPYVELGTSKMPAQPYLKPALEDNKARLTQLFNKGMRTK